MIAGHFFLFLSKRYAEAEEYFDRAIINFNGNTFLWIAYYEKGLLMMRLGNLVKAREAFQQSVYYRPKFPEGHQKLKEVEEFIKHNESIVVKIR